MTMPDRADDEHPRVDEQKRRHSQQHLDVEVQKPATSNSWSVATATIAAMAIAVLTRTNRMGGSQRRKAMATGIMARNCTGITQSLAVPSQPKLF